MEIRRSCCELRKKIEKKERMRFNAARRDENLSNLPQNTCH